MPTQNTEYKLSWTISKRLKLKLAREVRKTAVVSNLDSLGRPSQRLESQSTLAQPLSVYCTSGVSLEHGAFPSNSAARDAVSLRWKATSTADNELNLWALFFELQRPVRRLRRHP